MTNIELRQDPDFMEFEEYMTEKFLESLPLDKILSRYKPEERLAGLKPEERLLGLKPEEMKKLSELLKTFGA